MYYMYVKCYDKKFQLTQIYVSTPKYLYAGWYFVQIKLAQFSKAKSITYLELKIPSYLFIVLYYLCSLKYGFGDKLYTTKKAVCHWYFNRCASCLKFFVLFIRTGLLTSFFS